MAVPKEPLITLGFTTYNSAETVVRALQSGINQSWKNTEILVVDDASSDNTLAIIETFEKETDAQLNIIRHDTNKGVAAARNSILKNANGELIAFFDDDDESDPTRIEKQYQCLAAFEKKSGKMLVLSFCPRKQIYPDGRVRIETAPGMGDEIPGGENMAKRILWGESVTGGFGSMATCCLMARKFVFDTVGFFDENFERCEDTDLAVRHALFGRYFISCEQPLVNQTMTYGSEKTLDQELKYNLKLIEKHKDFIDNHFSKAFVECWLRAKFLYLRGQYPRFITALISLALRFPVKTIKKLIWAVPNRKFNVQTRRFHEKTVSS